MLQNLYGNWLDMVCQPFLFTNGGPAAPAARPVVVRSRFLDGVFTSSSGTLRYKLYIPAARSAGPMPLVVMLHGCGQSAEDFASGTDMNVQAEQQGCMVLYPEQPIFGASRGCWSWFDTAHQQRDRGECALIAGATRQVMADHPVQPERVFVAGMSAGGAMALVLARAYPDIFAAVGCHSGLPIGCAEDTGSALHAMRHGSPDTPVGVPVQVGRAVPVIVFHGDSDDTVHLSNGATVVDHSLATVRAGRSRHARRRAGVSKETGEARGRAYTRVVHRQPNGAVIAEHWVIHGGGHAWSGGNWRGSYADQKGPSASAEMLRFFLACRPDMMAK